MGWVDSSHKAAKTLVRSKAVVLLLFIHCWLFPLFFFGGGGGVGVRSLFRFCIFVSVLDLRSSRSRELVALILLCSECHVAVVIL